MPVGASNLPDRLHSVTFRPERFGQVYPGFATANLAMRNGAIAFL